MAFNSIEYLCFLILVAFAYRVLPHRFGLPLLCLSSYYFYSRWNQYYLILILISTLVDFFCAQAIEQRGRHKKTFLTLSLLSNLGLLFTFKYYGFFSEIAHDLSHILGGSFTLPVFELLLPVGISFYTLQTMSYSIDVYQGKVPAEKNFLRFALYVCFFPQLVAGPIEKAKAILPQLIEKNTPSYEDYREGIQLITWGLFKKVVIADRLSIYVNWAFNHPTPLDNPTMAMAGFLANILIYADFSAYANIAIGSARCLGIRLSSNFNFPLFSRHMPDFWRRWHISLHHWFIDYVYVPLGGSQVTYPKFIMNIFLIFILSGLWHGAAWNFVVWSLFHFLLVIVHIHVYKLAKKLNFRFPSFWGWTCLGIVLVHIQRDLSMYLFFIPDLDRCIDIYMGFFQNSWSLSRQILGPSHLAGFSIIVFFTFFLFLVEGLHIRKSWSERFSAMPRPCRWAIYYFVLFSIFMFGVETDNPFIYFQF